MIKFVTDIKVKDISNHDYGLESQLDHIQYCARICYNSQNKFDPNLSEKWVKNLANKGHLSVLEHGTCPTLFGGTENYREIFHNNMKDWIKLKNYIEHNYYNSSNYSEIKHNNVRYTFECDLPIAITREINRHRILSISERSTRYYNFEKGSAVQVYSHNDDELDKVSEQAINAYKNALERGIKAEIARSVLPLNTMSKVIYTADRYGWENLISKRDIPQAHPIARKFVQEIKKQLQKY